MSEKYEIGSVVFSNWVIVDVIGEGSFGKVFRIQRSDDFTTDYSALKVITVPRNSSELRSLIEGGKTQEQAKRYFYGIVEGIVDEIKIMSKLKATANVVSYEDHEIVAHKDGIGWDILIRMELLHPLLPYAYEHPFSRRDIIKLGIDMCKALELCQKYNIIHRDIKPENIFVSDNGDYKLGDFGIARTIERASAELTKTGTYSYMAPEVYREEEYGFSVDIYSLGIVLYRLLNKNRIPFLPESPKEILPKDQENAIAKRMRGETIPGPFYSQGRLPEIVLKACAPIPSDRYSSPMQMRQELEAILYDASDSEQIYPDGDTLEIMRNYYATQKKRQREESIKLKDKTESAFSSPKKRRLADEVNASKTESAFGYKSKEQAIADQDMTESAFGYSARVQTDKRTKTSTKNVRLTGQKKGNRKKLIIGAVCICIVIIVGIGLFLLDAKRQETLEHTKRSHFSEIVAQADSLRDTAPGEALALYKEAQELYPDEVTPYVSYAYALYRKGEYQDCVTYIEEDLALGKEYDIAVQSQLSEILGAAYFELDDYAAAASFFRLSTAGGDITVPAMRDYAVSLGRLGSVDEANDVLQKMFDAGAGDDVTNYVQAEVDYARKDYTAAQREFEAVLNATEDVTLQKRALRSLAEVYRDCSGLARTGQSPIDRPASKETELLTNGIVQYGLRYDSTLWEMLALAYYEAYNTDPDVPAAYLDRAVECFEQVIELGVVKDYLYTNLYTIHYEKGDFAAAEKALADFEEAFPDAYLPHALRGMLLITIENGKPQSDRNYSRAKAEYEMAGSMIRGSDDATYYQQLESLIRNLGQGGWL